MVWRILRESVIGASFSHSYYKTRIGNCMRSVVMGHCGLGSPRTEVAWTVWVTVDQDHCQ